MSISSTFELYDLLSAYAFHSGPPADLTSFRRLMSLEGSFGRVTVTCFLLYSNLEKPHISVHHFLFHTAPTILHQFSRTTQPQRITLHNRTRGKVDWASTYKARYSQDVNPSTFVCLQTRQIFDRPENRLFKFLLHQIQICLLRVSPMLKNSYAWGKALCLENGKPLPINDYLSTIEYQLRKLMKNVYLETVELPLSIETQHLLAARVCKNKFYSYVADMFDLYNSVVAVPSWNHWNIVFGQTLPLPLELSIVGPLLFQKYREKSNG